jgi:D-cysteine desulfhydrase
VPAGGSSVLGVHGYVEAARELATQVEAGEMPEPDLIVTALGSGGTVAGLAAGVASLGMRARVVGVTVAQPAWIVEAQARSMARRCAPRGTKGALAHLEIDRRYLGPGYGHATDRAREAMVEGAKVGLALDLTYTAKAFAAALDRVDEGSVRTILFWHTLSSAPMDPLLCGAPEESAIDSRLASLFSSASTSRAP